MYALLDWDNTLRHHATLFAWEDYLIQKGAISEEAALRRSDYLKAHRNGQMDHDALSKACCESYLRAAEGMEQSQYHALLKDYFPQDRQDFAPHTPILFQWLKSLGIKPIIVSGAPIDVIRHYFDEFHIEEAYAFDYAFVGGRLDGTLLNSGGHNKQEVVAKCIEKYNEAPLLSMGDSVSDLPMLQASRFPIIVGRNKTLQQALPNALQIDCNKDGAEKLAQFLAFLEKELYQKENTL